MPEVIFGLMAFFEWPPAMLLPAFRCFACRFACRVVLCCAVRFCFEGVRLRLVLGGLAGWVRPCHSPTLPFQPWWRSGDFSAPCAGISDFSQAVHCRCLSHFSSMRIIKRARELPAFSVI